MEALLLTLLIASGILTFSFGLAWVVSSVAIIVEQIKIEQKKGIDLRDAADFWLIINNIIPIFLFIEIIKQTPRICKTIIQKWKEEGMLRASLLISVISGIVMMTSNHLLWGS